MSQQTFPVFVDQPGCTLRNFSIVGADVLTVQPTPVTDGLDGRGQFLCTIYKAANVVTITWNVAFGDIPYIFIQPAVGQDNTLVEIVTNNETTFVYQTFESDDNTAAVNDADLDVLVCGYNTTSFVS